MRRILPILALILGCPDASLEDRPPDDRILCRDVPRLQLLPENPRVGPGGIVAFEGRGGTGMYRFELEDAPSGGTLDAERGLYVAGEPDASDEPIVDRVILRDVGCAGNLFLSGRVEVVSRVAIVPRAVDVTPSQAIAFTSEGGSGDVRFALAHDGSGASITEDGAYVAGPSEGRDIVRVTDLETGDTADAAIDVSASAALELTAERVVLPVGSSMEAPVRGGSGELDAEGVTDAVAFDRGRIVGAAPGRTTLTLVDRFTAERVMLQVQVVASVAGSLELPGDRSGGHLAIRGGDLDGDGIDDAIVAMATHSLDAYRGGAVMVFRGTGSGLEETPARVWTGKTREERFGHAVTVGDFDGDGVDDLLVGALQDDSIRGDAGAVYVYRGREGAFFEDEPMRSLYGRNGGDRFGRGVALCDFDGDGDLDLAVGAADAEDISRAPRENQQGAVQIFESRDGGFPSVPDRTVYGELPRGGEWVAHDNMRLGESITAGDVDGDGFCDLVAYALQPDPDSRDDGAVFVFRGGEGGLERRPAIVWAAMAEGDRRNRFGFRLAVHDFDGDGRGEVVASHHGHDSDEQNDRGAVYLFAGRALEGEATTVLGTDDAAWRVRGAAQSNIFGFAFDVADMDGDGREDLVIAEPRGTFPESETSRAGMIHVFRGRSGALPEETPALTVEGVGNDERFGLGMGAVGNVNRVDGDDLVLFAPYHDTDDGHDAGALYFLPEDLGSATLLDPQLVPSGQLLGRSVSVLGDLDGDGYPEVAVGANEADREGSLNVGAVWIHRGTADGVELEPAMRLDSFSGHSSDDHLGWAMTPAGDFDGDGVDDFAVVARYDDPPTEPAEGTIHVGSCPTERVFNTGAVYVFQGTPGGLPASQPAFVYYGPGGELRSVAAGTDLDGDGYDDLLVGRPGWNGRQGGFALVRGGPSVSGTVVVRCEADHVYLGEPETATELGAGLAWMEDLDGDGCPEIAAGAPAGEVDSGRGDEGFVDVILGWDGWSEVSTCARTTPGEVIRVYSGSRFAQAGRQLASADLDGDGLPDLIVGADDYRDSAGEVGRVYVALGSYLQTLAEPAPMLDPLDERALVLDGRDAGEFLGTSVAAARIDGRWMIAAGATRAAISGEANTGGVRVHVFGASGIEARPYLLMAGEATEEGVLGYRLGLRDGRLVVGAPWSDARSVDMGAVYVAAVD